VRERERDREREERKGGMPERELAEVELIKPLSLACTVNPHG
jgi:hypothetical protein